MPFAHPTRRANHSRPRRLERRPSPCFAWLLLLQMCVVPRPLADSKAQRRIPSMDTAGRCRPQQTGYLCASVSAAIYLYSLDSRRPPPVRKFGEPGRQGLLYGAGGQGMGVPMTLLIDKQSGNRNQLLTDCRNPVQIVILSDMDGTRAIPTARSLAWTQSNPKCSPPCAGE
jgi:hypothetical protein